VNWWLVLVNLPGLQHQRDADSKVVRVRRSSCFIGEGWRILLFSIIPHYSAPGSMVLKAPLVACGCAAISVLWVVSLGSGAFEFGDWL
jgi:hypothetical protein